MPSPSESAPDEVEDRAVPGGLEMAAHKEFSIATDVHVYFRDPRSPWQRGTNQNANRLHRQYFPKGTDLSVRSQADLNRTASASGLRTPAQPTR